MYNFDQLLDELIYEGNLTMSKTDIEKMLRIYIVPSFNRDYPHVRTISVNNTSKFYPHTDLTGYDSTNFLNHIYMIKQNRDIQMMLKDTITGISDDEDCFTIIASTELVRRILSMSYKAACFVHSPMILFDTTKLDYYYQLDSDGAYVFVYMIMNNIFFDSTTNPGDCPINPSEYDALKYYSMQKITDYIINGLDMSTVGVMDEFVSKLLSAMGVQDVSSMFNPSISSLSLGGEMSISFASSSSIIQTLTSALPSITNGYQTIQRSLRTLSAKSYKRYKNQLRKKFIWLFMV